MARSFNGSTDKVTATAVNPNTFGTSITIAGWINPATIGGVYGGVMGYNGSFGLFVRNATLKGAYYILGATGSASLDTNAGITITNNVWHHFGFTFTISSGGTAYIDGVSDGSIPAGTVATSFQSNASIFLGTDNAGDPYKGNLADCTVWNAALTAGEFAALAKGARPSTIRPLSLQGYWPLDGLQSPEPDTSGFAHNGTLTGTGVAFGPPFMQFTPRWPLNIMAAAAAGQSFQAAWAMRNRIVVEGIGI